MNKYSLGIFVLLGLSCAVCFTTRAIEKASPPLRLDNGILRVEFAQDAGNLRVTDLRSDQVWKQALVVTNTALRQRVVSRAPDGRSAELECGLDGTSKKGKRMAAPFRLSVSLQEGQPDLVVRFEARAEGEWREAAYPYVFLKEGSDVYNLYPHSEGMLVPANKADPAWLELPDGPLYGGIRSYLMCLGLVDMRSGTGLLTLLPNIESTHILSLIHI